MTTMIIIVILWFRPLDNLFSTKMEVFNESINLVVLYLLMTFSDFVRDPKTRSDIGTFYIAVIIAFASVHIVFMLHDSCKQLYWRAKRRLIRFVAKRKQAKKLKQQKQANTAPLAVVDGNELADIIEAKPQHESSQSDQESDA